VCLYISAIAKIQHTRV